MLPTVAHFAASPSAAWKWKESPRARSTAGAIDSALVKPAIWKMIGE
jgi:hypothetical protein